MLCSQEIAPLPSTLRGSRSKQKKAKQGDRRGKRKKKKKKSSLAELARVFSKSKYSHDATKSPLSMPCACERAGSSAKEKQVEIPGKEGSESERKKKGRLIALSLVRPNSVSRSSLLLSYLAVQELLGHSGSEAIIRFVVGVAFAGARGVGARGEQRRRRGRRRGGADDDARSRRRRR